jgi:DNA-binding GntR family transcriptional regulator
MLVSDHVYLAKVDQADEISDESGEYVYVQLAAIIRGQIESGRITGRLPSVRTLTETYGISHVTATSALKLLADEGLVYPVKGRGWFLVRN